MDRYTREALTSSEDRHEGAHRLFLAISHLLSSEARAAAEDYMKTLNADRIKARAYAKYQHDLRSDRESLS